MKRHFKSVFMASAVIISVSELAAAQDQKLPDELHLDATITSVTRLMTDKWLDEDHHLIIKSVAHQQAVASFCDKFDVDQERLVEVLADVYPGGEVSIPPAQMQELEKAIMFTYGTFLGAQMAAVAADVPAACAHAEEELADPAGRHLIWMVKK